jgi:hypothetical protein
MKINKPFVFHIPLFDNVKELCIFLRDNIINRLNSFFSSIVFVINAHEEKLSNIRPYVENKNIKNIFIGVNNSEPIDDLLVKEIVFYIDENNNRLKVKVKYSNGIIKYGHIDLY